MAQKFITPITVKQLASAGSDAVTVYVDADTEARLKIEAGGRLTWGSGSVTGDVNLYRDSADVLKTDDTLKVPTLFVDSIEVDTTGATTNQVLKFNGTKFAPGTASTVGAIDDLSDVTITSPTNGQILKWNGTAWVNDTDVAGSSINALDDVADVTITSAANNDLLKWNGTAWVNTAGYALLASPTFTGTPTLPTGTIATTQTAGNNTTAVATTAFVSTAVSGATVVVSSATAPVSPTAGLVWFNTSTGASYIYYNSTWVELGGGTMSPYQVTSPTRPASPWTGQTIYETDTKIGYQYDGTNWGPTYPGSGFRNVIINGGFDVWQRGTTCVGLNNSPTYCADRWVHFRSLATNYTTTRQPMTPSELSGFNYCARVQRNSGDTATANVYLIATFESTNVKPLAAKTVTFSFYARKGANFSGSALNVNTAFGTGTDTGPLTEPTSPAITTSAFTLTNSWQRFSQTISVASTATAARVLIDFAPTGTAGANDYFEITGVQLEANPQATPFEQRPIGVELALCQRYYWRISGATAPNVGLASAFGTGSTAPAARRMIVPLPVSMRVIPTVSLAGTHALYNSGLNNRVVVSFGFASSSVDRISIDVNSSVATTGGEGLVWVIDTSSANDYLQASAEL